MTRTKKNAPDISTSLTVKQMKEAIKRHNLKHCVKLTGTKKVLANEIATKNVRILTKKAPAKNKSTYLHKQKRIDAKNARAASKKASSQKRSAAPIAQVKQEKPRVKQEKPRVKQEKNIEYF